MKKQILSIVLLLMGSNSFAGVHYVSQAGAGTKDGLSWANASDDLQATINTAAAGDEIWVAAGSYLPNRRADATGTVTANNRNNAFVLKKDVAVYGGFAGSETSLSARNWTTHISTLSGDIGTAGDNKDNCTHIVISAGDLGTARLDGFTVQDGNASTGDTIIVNAQQVKGYNGGGIYAAGSSALISNCTISGNEALNAGGGIYCNKTAAPVIDNNIISGNKAFDGGGVNMESSAPPVISNCTILKNEARNWGGGIYVEFYSSAIVYNCTISNNTGARGGGIHVIEAKLVLHHCSILDNSARDGAGLCLNRSAPEINNCLISGNDADYSGGGIYSSVCSYQMFNCTIVDNTAYLGIDICAGVADKCNVYNSIVRSTSTYSGGIIEFHNSMSEGLAEADGNKDFNNHLSTAIFADPAAGDYRLKPGSPAMDAGDNSYYYTGMLSTDKDLVGNTRLYGTSIDMGAYEWTDKPTSIHDAAHAESGIVLYPNPAKAGNLVQLQFDNTQVLQGGGTIQLMDINGRVVYTADLTKSVMQQIALPETPGLYLLRVSTATSRTNLKLVVQ
jgi:parallel beta-helix repeat protein